MAEQKTGDVFQLFIDYIEGLTEQGKNKYFFDWHIRSFERRSKELQRPYYKDMISETSDGCVVIIYWAPDGRTRPHSHGGSLAKIHVLRGGLAGEVFEIGEAPPVKTASRKIYSTHKDRDIIENPGVVHRICNVLLNDWSVSIHKFKRDFTMEVYDFTRNLRWPIRGEEDTLGDPPENAIPIWPIQ